MKPILYAATETAFTSNGVGVLADCISCLVTEERNGEYELEMQYPSNGLWSEDIDVGMVIKAKANDTDAPQLFQIYDIARSLSAAYVIKAEHISYRLSGVPLKPYSAAGVAATLAGISSHAVANVGFTFSTDFTNTTNYSFTTPRSVRSLLGGAEGSLLDLFGGEYHFNNFKVELLKARGSDNGVTIRYGKNLTELEQDVNGAVYNGIFPYWYKENEGVVYPSSAVAASGSYPVQCYEALDLTNDFKTKPTAAQLTARAQSLVNGYGAPVESISLSFITLHQLKEYETIAALEHVSLCDVVHVIYDAIGVNVKTKVVKTVYNTLTELYDAIEVGALQTTLADVITRDTGAQSATQGIPPVSVASGSGTATSGTSVTQVTLTAFGINSSSDVYSLSSGGIKVAKSGLYRVSGSVYITPANSTTMLGCYIKVGSSFSAGSEVAGTLAYMGTTGARAIQCAPKIVNLTAGQIIFLASRCRGAAGTHDAGHSSTYLQVEALS